MRKHKILGLALLLLTAVLLLPAGVRADGLVRITKPADGTAVRPGTAELWTTFAYSGESTKELSAKINPMTVQVLKDGEVISTQSVTMTGSVAFTEEGAHYADLSLPEEGTYTIRVSVPGSAGEWDSVTVRTSYKEAGSYPGEDEFITEDTAWWPIVPESENPGCTVSLNKQTCTIDLKGTNTGKIKYTFSIAQEAYASLKPYIYFSDRIKQGGNKIIRYKDHSTSEFQLKDGKYVATGWVEYAGRKAGTTQVEIWLSAQSKWYSRQVVTVNVQAPNTMTVQAKKVSVKASALKNKSQTLLKSKAFTVAKARGSVTFKKVSGNQKITIAKNGRITLRKGLKKGTYKLKVKVTAAGNEIYKKLSKDVTVAIQVK